MASPDTAAAALAATYVLGYTGQFRDDTTGLQLHGVRWYDAATGRWLSEDPGGFIDGPNLYAYTRNNPVNGIDPSGYAMIKFSAGTEDAERAMRGVNRGGIGIGKPQEIITRNTAPNQPNNDPYTVINAIGRSGHSASSTPHYTSNPHPDYSAWASPDYVQAALTAPTEFWDFGPAHVNLNTAVSSAELDAATRHFVNGLLEQQHARNYAQANTTAQNSMLGLFTQNYAESLSGYVFGDSYAKRIGNYARSTYGTAYASAAVSTPYNINWTFDHVSHEIGREVDAFNRDRVGYLLEAVHTTLDVVGQAPVIGEVADGLNAVLYFARNQPVNAMISLAGMAIGAGNVATGSRLVAKNMSHTARAVDTFVPAMRVGGALPSAQGRVLGDVTSSIASIPSLNRLNAPNGGIFFRSGSVADDLPPVDAKRMLGIAQRQAERLGIDPSEVHKVMNLGGSATGATIGGRIHLDPRAFTQVFNSRLGRVVSPIENLKRNLIHEHAHVIQATNRAELYWSGTVESRTILESVAYRFEDFWYEINQRALRGSAFGGH